MSDVRRIGASRKNTDADRPTLGANGSKFGPRGLLSDDRRMVKGPERRTERFTLRLPASLRDAIDRLSAEDGRSPSDWIVRELQLAVADHDKKSRR